jgi:hypothetical protein
MKVAIKVRDKGAPLVGTIEPGASWTDNNPPSTAAFYVVIEPAP